MVVGTGRRNTLLRTVAGGLKVPLPSGLYSYGIGITLVPMALGLLGFDSIVYYILASLMGIPNPATNHMGFPDPTSGSHGHPEPTGSMLMGEGVDKYDLTL